MEQPILLITGCTGYLGSWIARKATETGKYRVRGTTRNPSSKRATKLKEKCPGLDLVACELMSDGGWKEAFEGVEYLLHTASPFNVDPKFDFVTPALEGTKRVLGFAKDAGVKKIVVTSSNAAVSWCQQPGWKMESREYGEKDWTIVPEGATDYESSKNIAEKAVWTFAEENKDISICCINPGVICGVSLLGTAGGTLDIWKQMSTAGMCMEAKMPYIYVEDCAEIHVNAIGKVEELNGRRVVSCQAVWFVDVFERTAEVFNPMGYNFPTSNMPGCLFFCLFRCCCCINPLQEFKPMMFHDYTIDNKLAASLTNSGKLRGYDQECVDMTYDFIESGGIPKAKGYVPKEKVMDVSTIDG